MNIGDKLGPYEILAPIGAGGMGEVYKARDTRLDRTVAVKVLPEYIAKREDLRARFEREARAVASLKHPNIWYNRDGTTGTVQPGQPDLSPFQSQSGLPNQ
jgi:eukaryotic-like serine/threonine-protein kinase